MLRLAPSLGLGITLLAGCPTANTDTDVSADTDTSADTGTVDADSDGVAEADDCDDADPDLGEVSDDADCDGLLTEDDCDDGNVESFAVGEDPDCNGVEGLAVPPEAASGAGESAGFFGPGSQVISHGLFLESDLTDLAVGDAIHGFAIRLAGTATEAYVNAVTPTYDRFDVKIGEAASSLGAVGDNLSDHWSGVPTTVRTGTLTFADGSLQPPAAAGEVSPWGPPILFDAPYSYAGGDLLLEVVWTVPAASTGLLIDVFEGVDTRSGFTVFHLGDPESDTINNVWEANWAIVLYTDDPR